MTAFTLQDATERIRAYIQENYLYMRPDAVVGDNDLLLAKGIVDSMAVMELVTLLEDEFGVQPTDAEITEENFGSVGAIARFALAKRAARAAAS